MDTPFIVDLLHATPMVRFDLELAHEILRFSFSAGGSDATSDHKLRSLRMAFSTWDPACFEADLFLESFVEKHSEVEVQGQTRGLDRAHLRQTLAHPPHDVRTLQFRQHIVAELLANPAARTDLEVAYARASRLFALFEDSGLGYRLDVNRRRVDILAAIAELIDGLSRSFGDAQSGLRRLREYGTQVRASEAFARLRSVVEIERNMTSVDARIRLGYEGQIRHFEIVGVSEQRLNPFYATRLGRLTRRFLLLLRGYRFSDTEVLSQFVDDVFEGVSKELAALFQLLRDMEFYLAALHFHRHSTQHGLAVCLPSFMRASPGQSSPRRVEGLFNPLLVGDGRAPTACSLEQPHHTDVLVLTGPNSGGKTRMLQALSYCQLLGQAGFLVPAAAAQLVWCDGMFLAVVERTESDQREGRLGSELMRIRRVFEHARVGAFVVVDELCSGTNPEEGQEIFTMVLDLLQQLGVQAVVSTHFLEFARALASGAWKQRLQFLRVAVDGQNRPTYQFESGVAQSSLAQHTAARLGVTREELQSLVLRRQREQVAVEVSAGAAPPGPARGATSQLPGL